MAPARHERTIGVVLADLPLLRTLVAAAAASAVLLMGPAAASAGASLLDSRGQAVAATQCRRPTPS